MAREKRSGSSLSESWTARLGGVGIVLSRPLSAGASFLLKLNLKPAAFAVYDVRHCRPSEDGYVIGAEFHGFIGSPNIPEPDGETICKAIIIG
jgi:hypothetical protein